MINATIWFVCMAAYVFFAATHFWVVFLAFRRSLGQGALAFFIPIYPPIYLYLHRDQEHRELWIGAWAGLFLLAYGLQILMIQLA